MKKAIILLLFAALTWPVLATDVTGTWKAQFDTQRGLQKYTFTLKQDGTNVTGKASADTDDGKRDSDLKEGGVNGDKVSFVELLSAQGNDIRITFTGKFTTNENEIKFTRDVGDFGSSEAMATRDAASAPAPTPPTQAATPNVAPNTSEANPEAPFGGGGRRGGGRGGATVALDADDKPAFPHAPQGFDQRHDDIEHGNLVRVDYDATALGFKRWMQVYTPPGYNPNEKYPMLILLHGIGGNEIMEWTRNVSANIVLDNLYAEKKIVPMIVVFPNGNASAPNANGAGNGGNGGNGGRGGGGGFGGGRGGTGGLLSQDQQQQINTALQFDKNELTLTNKLAAAQKAVVDAVFAKNDSKVKAALKTMAGIQAALAQERYTKGLKPLLPTLTDDQKSQLTQAPQPGAAYAALFGGVAGGGGGFGGGGGRGGGGGDAASMSGDGWGANFETDLIKDIIPYMESHYPVIADREHRALAGLSMGGGQALDFGLTHLDTFAWIGGFSVAPNTRTPQQLVPDPAKATQMLKLLWISGGDQDGLLTYGQRTHRYLKANNVPHVWTVDHGGHDAATWKNNLYLFSERLFR